MYLARRFQKLFFKLSKPPRSLQKDSFNIRVLQSFLALSEGDSPDRSLLIRRHTQHKKHVQNTLNHVHFMNLFSVNKSSLLMKNNRDRSSNGVFLKNK